ncbi:uncharacterized protein EI90DRAFT_2903231 [Cantharellus anzutake]|uniref:uncharacterized protein n=1 Tax=Cantharellus anzutake TaxID=1750568 RepID=UPI0019074336|nr:uncharacterized protein EI90DRAFT_2903231 [Cantharellus anzutake]KAF8343121.1 hypothetical protein EI90DRAFT_2903231 [Cantharellus anzutake]
MASKPGGKPPAPSAPLRKKEHKASSKRRNKPRLTKPPRSREDQLRRYFTSLCAQIDAGFPKNAIKTCNRILRLLPNDEDTSRTKLFLLLQTDQYKEALSLLEESQGSLRDFSKAYVLYRLRREDEAAAILSNLLQNAGSGDSGALHLDAQVKYRAGDYEGARAIYEQLLDTCPPDTDEYSDILTNIAAAQAHIDFFTKDYLKAVHSLPNLSSLESLPPPSTATHTHLPLQPSPGDNQPTAPVALKPPRKSRIPKNVVLGVTPMPDPERWLKKRERTKVDGRWKKAKKGGMGIGATQGSIVPESKSEGPSAGGSGGGARAGAGKKGKKK